MRHALGVLGVLAASVLLLVSAAMNWRFGYSIGKSELDSQLLGLASASADGLKALIPFFLFAALRNKQWSQAIAAGLLWGVCLSYSLTSALGFAALNRADTSGVRTMQAATYADLRTELDRTRERLSWVPQHRPAATVEQEIGSLQQSKRWKATSGCTKGTVGGQVAFCQQYHQLAAELGSAREAEKLQARIDEIRTQLTSAATPVALAGADPQAEVLSGLYAAFLGSAAPSEETQADATKGMQIALILMVAILVELGSSLGYYVVFSNWKIYDTHEKPIVVSKLTAGNAVSTAPLTTTNTQVTNANDNRTAPKLVAPETDVEKFYKERVTKADGSSLTATTLYEDYCDWCDENGKEAIALPTFGRQFGELGVHKAKIAGRIRYIGIRLHSGIGDEEVDRTAVASAAAA